MQMDITEEKVFEAFGLPQGEKGGNEREAADPAPEETQTDSQTTEEGQATGTGQEGEDTPGEREQETADPAAEPEQEQGQGQPAQTEEQRRENAARRRREETQTAIDAAVQKAVEQEQEKARKQMEGFFAAANLKNTITGEPITTMEEFNAWKEAFDAEQLQKDLKNGRLTPEGLERVLGRMPAVRRMEALARSQEQAREQAELAAAQAKVDGELAEIGKLDPNIKSVEDLLKMPKAKEFYEYVKKGNSFLDAYYLSHREELAQRQAAAARQQAQNLSRSKDHLTHTGIQGDGAAAVPPEDMAMFRQFNPNATESEIQAYYNKYKQK